MIKRKKLKVKNQELFVTHILVKGKWVRTPGYESILKRKAMMRNRKAFDNLK